MMSDVLRFMDNLVVKKHISKPIIGIIGGHLKNTNSKAFSLAEKTGEELAKLGFAIACGGEDGIMEAVCRGAKKYNGVTIAILKGNKKESANKYVDYVILTSLDLAFMNVLVWSSDGIIAFDGRFGTLSEIGLILDIGRPLVLLGKHELVNSDEIRTSNCIHITDYSDRSIKSAIDFLISKISQFN